MKIKLAALFAAFGYFCGGASAENAATCRTWNCQEGLGAGQTGANRVCANFTGSASVAEQCSPDTFLCNVRPDLSASANCTEFNPLPWKKDLPPGDSCTVNAECHSNNCTEVSGTRVCIGLAQNATCRNDLECEAGLFCQEAMDTTLTCQPVQRIGQPCNGNLKCDFGGLCVNHTCTRIGTLPTGTFFNVTDDEVYPDINSDVRSMYWACENFYAVITNKISQGGDRFLFECTNGPEKAFGDNEYARAEGNLDCIFNMTRTSGEGVTLNFTETAKCGYNRDEKFYCPSRRGAAEYKTQNSLDRATWSNAPTSCHLRTTIQYCRDIEGDIGRSLGFRNFLRTEWITTEDNWSLVANNDRCVGNAIAFTRSYWRLIDSATGFIVSSFALVAGLFVITFA